MPILTSWRKGEKALKARSLTGTRFFLSADGAVFAGFYLFYLFWLFWRARRGEKAIESVLAVALERKTPVLPILTGVVEEAAQVGAGFVGKFASETGRLRVEFERDFRFSALRSRRS